MFKTMTGVLKNTPFPPKENIEKISSFIMIRWLSGNQNTVIPANIINVNYNLPIYNQYRFLDDYFKLTGLKNKKLFIKYNKKQEKISETQKNIQRYYNINQETAKQYYNLMSKEEHKRFNNMYKEGKI